MGQANGSLDDIRERELRLSELGPLRNLELQPPNFGVLQSESADSAERLKGG